MMHEFSRIQGWRKVITVYEQMEQFSSIIINLKKWVMEQWTDCAASV